MNNGFKNTLLILLSFFFIGHTSMCMEEGDPKRNWRSSLNLHYHEHIFFNGDEWIVEKNPSITIGKAKNLLKSISKKSKYVPNISKASFTIIFSHQDNISFSTFDVEKFFFSGQLDFDTNHEVISAQTFQKKEDLGNDAYNNMRKQRILELFNIELVTATCAEASILEYLNNTIKDYIINIKHGKEGEVKILGTILEVSSLKDPCSQNCIPMFEGFMPRIHTILNTNIIGINGVSLVPILENIVLLAGRGEHANSRNRYHENNLSINLNFENPSNRIYSKIND